MCKKCVLRGFKGISALLLLSALLIGCPPPPEGGPGIGQIFFAGNFAEGVGEIELFVLGPALSSQRTLARSLTEGHELYAHVMHDDRMLRLEGAYDHISDGFVLSAREETFVYSIFGQLDFNGDFQFAEISVTTRVNDEWTMRSHLINSNPTVSLPEDGFSRGLGGVPSGIAGSVDIWIPWFMEDDNHRRWSMISPAAMVEFELDPEKGFPEEVSRRNFLHFEAVGNEEANVVSMYTFPSPDSLSEKFPVLNEEGHIDSYGNTHWRDAMISAALNKASAGWGDLERYYDKTEFNTIGKAYLEQHKSAITAAFGAREEWQRAIWWFDANIVAIEIWEEWLDREEEVQSDPSSPWYVPGWDRATHFAQRQENGEVFTVDGVDYKVMWDFSFKFNPFKTWRENLTQAQWEQIQESTDKVFHDYVWKYRRDLTSNAYEENFLLSKGVVFQQYYYRDRIGKDAWGPTIRTMAASSEEYAAQTTENFSEAINFTHIVEQINYSLNNFNDGQGRVINRRNYSIKLSEVLSALSAHTKPASEFEGKTMGEVFVLLNNSSIINFEQLDAAISAYMTPTIESMETEYNMDNLSFGIANTTSPYYSTDPTAYSYSIISEWTPGLRNSTRVRPTLMVVAGWHRVTYPEWWNADAPGKIAHTLNKTLMDVLAEIGPGMAFNANPGDFNFASIEFGTINTWGELAFALGYYNETGGEAMLNMNELKSNLQMYTNSFWNEKPLGVPADLDFDSMASGMFKDGVKVEFYNVNIDENTPFVSDEFSFKIIFSREATWAEKGMGEDGSGGRGSIRFLKRILNRI